MTHLGPTAGANHEPEPDDPMADQLGADVRRAANDAREAVRLVAHLTLGAPALPAPEVYFALADLERLGHGLAQALRQLGVSLQRSLDAYDVTQDKGTDPADAVDRCVFELLQAVADATDLGQRLGRGHAAIAGQGHLGRIPTIGSIGED